VNGEKEKSASVEEGSLERKKAQETDQEKDEGSDMPQERSKQAWY